MSYLVIKIKTNDWLAKNSIPTWIGDTRGLIQRLEHVAKSSRLQEQSGNEITFSISTQQQ